MPPSDPFGLPRAGLGPWRGVHKVVRVAPPGLMTSVVAPDRPGDRPGEISELPRVGGADTGPGGVQMSAQPHRLDDVRGVQLAPPLGDAATTPTPLYPDPAVDSSGTVVAWIRPLNP